MEAAGQAQAVNGGHSNAAAKARQCSADTRERGKPSALNALTFANCSEGQGAHQSHAGRGGRGNATTAGGANFSHEHAQAWRGAERAERQRTARAQNKHDRWSNTSIRERERGA
jgi:hypothetical protein